MSPTILSNLARLREFRLHSTERTAALGFGALRAGEIDEAVAVIDLDVQQNQHAKTECAGTTRGAREKIPRPETFRVTVGERGVISVKTRNKSTRYKAVELVLNQIKGALQRVSFAV